MERGRHLNSCLFCLRVVHCMCCLCRCVNYTAHLGRWAIPVTRDADDLGDKVCGIDGCF